MAVGDGNILNNPPGLNVQRDAGVRGFSRRLRAARQKQDERKKQPCAREISMPGHDRKNSSAIPF
jgi:hypothetical protein